MKLRSGSTTRYGNIDYIIDEIIYILNTNKIETELRRRVYKIAELFELLIANRNFVLDNNTISELFQKKLYQLKSVGIDNYSKEYLCNKWQGTDYYYNNIFNSLKSR